MMVVVCRVPHTFMNVSGEPKTARRVQRFTSRIARMQPR
jgi:hypothetical protein